jgi:tetratricopeptide (TPR) repeat protein
MNRSALFCTVVLFAAAWAAPSSAAEKKPPAPPVVLKIGEVRVECREKAVVGLHEGKEIWTLRHPSLGLSGTEAGQAISPVASGGLLYYGVGTCLLAVNPVEGRVVRRVLFSARIHLLKPEGEGVRVTSWRGGKERATPPREIVLRPGDPDPAPALSGSFVISRAPAVDADTTNGDFGAMPTLGDPPGARHEGARRERAEQAVPVLSDQAERDPTNPYWRLELGLRLLDLGRAEEGLAELRRALDVEGPSRVYLLRVSSELERRGCPELAEAAFDKGYRAFLEAGLEPELMYTLIGVTIHSPPPKEAIRKAVEARDLDRAAKLLERVWKVGPLVEGAAYAYAGMAQEFRKAGREADAAVWEARAKEAAPARVFGRIGESGRVMSLFLDLTAATILALFVYAFFLVLKYGPLALHEARAARSAKPLFLFRFWTRRELAAVLLMAALPVAFLLGLARNLSIVGQAARFDLDAGNGSFGTPEALAYWKSYAGHDAGKEIYALGLLQGGKPDEAENMLRALTKSAPAQNNLGVALSRQGKVGEAKAAFEAALRIDSGLQEARYNLGQEAGGPRVERAKAFLPGSKVLAMPSPSTFLSTWVRGPENGPGAFDSIVDLSGVTSALGIGNFGAVSLFYVILFFLFAVPSIVCLLHRPLDKRPEPFGPHWWVGFIMPGVQGAWAPFGVLFLALFIAAALVIQAHTSYAGSLSLLDAIAMPGIARSFGIQGTLAAEFWVWAVIKVSWALLFGIPILNAAALLWMRFGARKPETKPEAGPAKADGAAGKPA